MTNDNYKQFALWLTLNRISDNISKHEEKLFRKTHLTKTQHRVLLTITFLKENNKKPVRLTDLLPFLNINPSSMSLIIDRMEKKDLVNKVRNKSNQRTVMVTITKRGKKLLNEFTHPTVEFIQKIFSVFSKSELNEATSLMNKLLEAVEIETQFQEHIKYPLSLSREYRDNYLSKLYHDFIK